MKSRPFDIKVSETGVNLNEAAEIGKAVGKSHSNEIDQVRDIVALFQQGPHTGNPVYNEKYAQDIGEMIVRECPSGRISQLVSVREMRKYPAISGEIVKVTGRCITGEN